MVLSVRQIIIFLIEILFFFLFLVFFVGLWLIHYIRLFFELMFKIFPLTVSSWLVVLCIETKGVWIITSGGSAFTYEIILESDAFPTELLAFISIKFCPSSNKTDEVKMSLDGLYKKLVCCNPFTKKEIWLAADTFNTFAETTSWLV